MSLGFKKIASSYLVLAALILPFCSKMIPKLLYASANFGFKEIAFYNFFLLYLILPNYQKHFPGCYKLQQNLDL